MKVLICFEDSCEHYDVSPDITVMSLKQMVQKTFLLQLDEDQHVRHYLEMSYCGAILWDNWTLKEVSFRSHKTIRCTKKSEQKAVLHVLNAVMGETIPIFGTSAVLQMLVGQLKSIVSAQSGLPVSVFRLSTDKGVELYDCNNLQDYALEAGAYIHLDTWNGWLEFLQGCLLGNVVTVQKNLSKDHSVLRFQLRVALYISASSGHLNLADWLLERRAHAEEPVGVHPCRQWCHRTAHRDTGKCPIHVATAKNHLHIIKLFISRRLLTLVCRDPRGREPLKIAIEHGHKDCVRYLANKMFSVVSLPNLSLPVYIYIKIKQWAILCQRKVALNQCHYTMTLQTRMGQTMLIDGFNKEIFFSKSQKTTTKLQQFIINTKDDNSISSHLKPQQLGQHKAVKQEKTKMKQSPLHKGRHRELTASLDCSVKPTLPKHSASTCCVATHNAVSYMAVASTFTDMPWLKQLSIARTLLRKHLQQGTRELQM